MQKFYCLTVFIIAHFVFHFSQYETTYEVKTNDKFNIFQKIVNLSTTTTNKKFKVCQLSLNNYFFPDQLFPKSNFLNSKMSTSSTAPNTTVPISNGSTYKKTGWHPSHFWTVSTYFCFNSVLISPLPLLIGPRGN